MHHGLSIRWLLVCWLISLGLLAVSPGSHAATLTAVQAKDHIGETATVCGVVASATFAARTNETHGLCSLTRLPAWARCYAPETEGG
jgi:hypothetical protein